MIKPVIYAIVGPSASGKDTLARFLSERLGYNSIVSWTSRPPRAGEENGEDYWFVSREEFESTKSRGAFIEWSEFNGWFYGTPYSAIQKEVNVGVFNLDGLVSQTIRAFFLSGSHSDHSASNLFTGVSRRLCHEIIRSCMNNHCSSYYFLYAETIGKK